LDARPIVQPGALDPSVIDLEAERLDEVELGAGR